MEIEIREGMSLKQERKYQNPKYKPNPSMNKEYQSKHAPREFQGSDINFSEAHAYERVPIPLSVHLESFKACAVKRED